MLAELNIQFSNINSDSSAPKEDDGNDEVCIANISPEERRKRLRYGIIQLVFTLTILAFLVITGADKLWRLPLLFMFWAATASYFQWRDKT